MTRLRLKENGYCKGSRLINYLVLQITRQPDNQIKIITVTGYKGGVAKSTTAIHIATYFSDRGKTILVDGDPNRTALSWAQRGKLPFTVADERQAMKTISARSVGASRQNL